MCQFTLPVSSAMRQKRTMSRGSAGVCGVRSPGGGMAPGTLEMTTLNGGFMRSAIRNRLYIRIARAARPLAGGDQV